MVRTSCSLSMSYLLRVRDVCFLSKIYVFVKQESFPDMGTIRIRCAVFIVAVVAVVWVIISIVTHAVLVNLPLTKSSNGRRHSVSDTSRVFIDVACSEQVVEVTDRKCAKRLMYLKVAGRHDCFKLFNVSAEADDCDILKYLIYVERVCPELENSSMLFRGGQVPSKLEMLHTGRLARAKWINDTTGIKKKMMECGEVCNWMKRRIESMSVAWEMALQNFSHDERKLSKYRLRRKLTILLHLGLLTKEFGLDFGRKAFLGGPLGELVQWADLATALHLLGHEVILSWSIGRLQEILDVNSHTSKRCNRAIVADLVFTDIYGMEQMRKILGTLHYYRCRLRILDVFGTEPQFNHPRYRESRLSRTGWGGKGLDTRQFFTQFPHTPDNSFLGFAVNEGKNRFESDVKRDRCLLYGKRSKYLSHIFETKILESLRRHFPDMHATMKEDSLESSDRLPHFVTNHGPLSQDNFTELLRSSWLYVGLRYPVEGPAALEAAANGVVFLNPKFSPPLQAHRDKPTNRTLTSQNPYAENYLGEPYVYTVDYQDEAEVDRVLQNIKSSKLNEPKVNAEFTHYGFLERIISYIENQHFCNEVLEYDVSRGTIWKSMTSVWPPESSLQIKKSQFGESCASTCMRNGLACEIAFFPPINKAIRFHKMDFHCKVQKEIGSLQDQRRLRYAGEVCYAPGYFSESGTCITQVDPLLFSCACHPPPSFTRLCPCRTFKREQISLCSNCD